MANHMLSVIGSIQPDPFSPEHDPKRMAPVSPESEEADEVLDQLVMESAVADELEDSEANNTFRRLGKRADEAKRAGLKAREEAEVAAVAVKAAKKGKKKRRVEETLTQDKDKKVKKAKRKKVE